MKTTIDQCNGCNCLQTDKTQTGWTNIGAVAQNVKFCPACAAKTVNQIAAEQLAALPAPATGNSLPFKYPNCNFGRLDIPVGATLIASVPQPNGRLAAQIKLTDGSTDTVLYPPGAIPLSPLPAPAAAAPVPSP